MGGAIEALRADREALLEIGEGLSDDQWGSPSGCPGWSVQDLVAHMGALFTVVVDPSSLPDAGDEADATCPDEGTPAGGDVIVGPETSSSSD